MDKGSEEKKDILCSNSSKENTVVVVQAGRVADRKRNLDTDTDHGDGDAATAATAHPEPKRLKLASEQPQDKNNAGLNLKLKPMEDQPQSKPQSQSPLKKEDIVDIAKGLELQPGTRIEVRWDLHYDDIGKVKSRWWGGTLLAYTDERIHTLQDNHDHDQVDNAAAENAEKNAIALHHKCDKVLVPIRVIDYDPFIEGGFPDRSLEDVCFLSDHSVLNLQSESRAYWRKEGDKWEPPQDMDEEERKLMTCTTPNSNTMNNNAPTSANVSDDDVSVTSTSQEAAVNVVLDTVLQAALQKVGVVGRMNQLDPVQQRIAAEKIAKIKEVLSEKLTQQLRNDNNSGDNGNGNELVVTKEHITRCMEEMKKNDL